MAEILYGPWPDKGEKILNTPDQFKESQQQLLEPMIKAQRSLLLATRPFRAASNVRPVHCRVALNALEDLSANVSVFCKLLSETDSLPIFISTFRYALLINLHRLRERISDATVLIDACRTSYTAMSYHTRQKQHDIFKAIEHILSDLQDFLLQLGFFETEIQFQEEKLADIVQDNIPIVVVRRSSAREIDYSGRRSRAQEPPRRADRLGGETRRRKEHVGKAEWPEGM